MFILDSHCDAPTSLIQGADFSKLLTTGHIDFLRMKKGKVNAAFFAIYTPNTMTMEESMLTAQRMIAKVYDAVEAEGGGVAVATTPAEALHNHHEKITSIFLGMENGAPIGTDISLLHQFYRQGVRYLTLTHNGNNEICDAALAKEQRWGGLSPFGHEVVRECNRIGMMIDVSHISDKSFYDVLEVSQKPVIASHSCCRALCDNKRNMTDDMIRALADKGGVIQINFYPAFLSDDFQDHLPSYKRIVDHIDHAVSLVGVGHVGIGSDFDGIEITPLGMEDICKMPKIVVEMRRRGYEESDIEKIMGGNFLRVMTQVQNID